MAERAIQEPTPGRRTGTVRGPLLSEAASRDGEFDLSTRALARALQPPELRVVRDTPEGDPAPRRSGTGPS